MDWMTEEIPAVMCFKEEGVVNCIKAIEKSYKLSRKLTAGLGDMEVTLTRAISVRWGGILTGVG